MHSHKHSLVASRTPFYFFVLLFSASHAEKVSSYFSLHKDRAINSVFFTSAHTHDVMLCAKACAAELNCNTAIYRTAEKRCDFSKERAESISDGAAVILLKGSYLIEKVKNVDSVQDTKDPSPSITWLHFTPQWCTLQGRNSLGNNEKTTAGECKEKCKKGCLGVEWWEKNGLCFECTDPSRKTGYTNTKDVAYPPHVFLKNGG